MLRSTTTAGPPLICNLYEAANGQKIRAYFDGMDEAVMDSYIVRGPDADQRLIAAGDELRFTLLGCGWRDVTMMDEGTARGNPLPPNAQR